MTGDAIRVTYLVRAAAREIAARADALLLEQTVELPRAVVRDAWVLEHVVGCVEDVREAGAGVFRVTVAQPLATAAEDPAQLLNVLYGNASLQSDVQLEDVELPAAAFDFLPGPRAGVAGLRELVGVHDRPLLAAALKPMGLPPERLAELCGAFARAGVDIIKDDHGLADHSFCPFEARVEACFRAVDDAAQATGRRALYVPNVTGTPDRIGRQLEFARCAGCRMAMIAPMLVGLPLLAQVASAADGLPILAHPALGGVLRVAPQALFGKLFRWYGADAVIFPHAGGRFEWSPETCRAIAAAQRAPHPRARPAFPMPGGGIRLDLIEGVVAFYGADCILLVGGSLRAAGGSLVEQTRALVERVAGAVPRDTG
jgi:ribulose-bisphosphate carboxylase large chain